MAARPLARRNGTCLVKATQGLPVSGLTPGKHMVASQVGLHVVFHHGLIRSVAASDRASGSTADVNILARGGPQRRAGGSSRRLSPPRKKVYDRVELFFSPVIVRGERHS